MEKIQSKYGTIEILYEDNHLLAAVKPPNLPAQGDLTGDEDILTLLKGYIGRKYNKPGDVYLGLVHRLDRPVGGVMVFARTSKAAARLSEQFAGHTTRKHYLAVLQGELKEERHLEHWLLARQGMNVQVVPEGVPGAKKASLTSTPVCVKDGMTLTDVTLESGRKHQIRVQHMNVGLPLWGDNRYGKGKKGMQIALWAYSLTIEHPTLKKPVTLTCLPPESGIWAKFYPEIKAHAEAAE